MATPAEVFASRRERLLWGVQMAALLYAIWFALDGLQNPLIGLVFAVAGAVTGTWLAPGVPYPWRPLRLLAFIAWFIRASWAGGVDVARRALSPSLPIEPCWHEHPLRLGTGLPRTAFVSIISLLPGTLSVRVLREQDVLLVHLLVPGGAGELDDLEARVAWLFSAPLKAPG